MTTNPRLRPLDELLSKQLDDITASLVAAAKRRDLAVKEKGEAATTVALEDKDDVEVADARQRRRLDIACQLEKAGCPWTEVKGWTTYLFSDGPWGHRAAREETSIVERAAKELEAIKTQVLAEEAVHRAAEEKKTLSRRLIVTNIAAGADLDTVEQFFYDFWYEIKSLKLLEARHPVQRTQTAHLDMHTRAAAKDVRYGYDQKAIYGLVPNIQLAVEDARPAPPCNLLD